MQINQLSVFWWKSKRNNKKEYVRIAWTLAHTSLNIHTKWMSPNLPSTLYIDLQHWHSTGNSYGKFIQRVFLLLSLEFTNWMCVVLFHSVCALRARAWEWTCVSLGWFVCVCMWIYFLGLGFYLFPVSSGCVWSGTELRCDTETNIYVLPHKINHPHASTSNRAYKHNYTE